MTALSFERPLFLPHRAGDPLLADGSEPAGPGWFESSWELRRGLEVREGESDGRLRTWIEDFLAGQAGASAGGRDIAPGGPQGTESRRSLTAAPSSITAIA